MRRQATTRNTIRPRNGSEPILQLSASGRGGDHDHNVMSSVGRDRHRRKGPCIPRARDSCRSREGSAETVCPDDRERGIARDLRLSLPRDRRVHDLSSSLPRQSLLVARVCLLADVAALLCVEPVTQLRAVVWAVLAVFDAARFAPSSSRARVLLRCQELLHRAGDAGGDRLLAGRVDRGR